MKRVLVELLKFGGRQDGAFDVVDEFFKGVRVVHQYLILRLGI